MLEYRKGYKYQLASNFCTVVRGIELKLSVSSEYISLSKSGLLFIESGYAWDGPSGLALDTKNFMIASLMHDALYQLMRMGLLARKYRLEADLELYRFCRQSGMFIVRAWLVYKAVRIFAGKFVKADQQKKVFKVN